MRTWSLVGFVVLGSAGAASAQTWENQPFEWRNGTNKRWGGTYGQYAVTLKAGTPYTVQTSDIVAGTSNDTVLYLLNSSYSIVAQDDNSAGNLASRILFTPVMAGTYYIRLRAVKRGTYGTCTLTVNSPPTLSSTVGTSVGVTEGTSLAFAVTATDNESAISAIVASNVPPGATNSGGNPTAFSWTPSVNQAGSYPVVFTATDSLGVSTSLTVSIAVRDNLPPTFTSSLGTSPSIGEGATLSFTVSASDPEGGAIAAVAASGLPAGAGAGGDNPITFSWTPSFTQAGSYTVLFSASDPLGQESTLEVSIAVFDNQPPVLVSSPAGDLAVDEGGVLTFTVSASDPEGGAIAAISARGVPAGASVSGGNPISFSWTPSYAQNGAYSVTFGATDPTGASSSLTVGITVLDVNRPPVLTASQGTALSIFEGDTVSFTVTASDPDLDPLGPVNAALVTGGGERSLPTTQSWINQRFEWQAAYANAWEGAYGEYFVTLVAGVPLEIQATVDVYQSRWTNDIAVYLLDSQGNVVDRAAGDKKARIVFTAPATAEYAIRVRAGQAGGWNYGTLDMTPWLTFDGTTLRFRTRWSSAGFFGLVFRVMEAKPQGLISQMLVDLSVNDTPTRALDHDGARVTYYLADGANEYTPHWVQRDDGGALVDTRTKIDVVYVSAAYPTIADITTLFPQRAEQARLDLLSRAPFSNDGGTHFNFWRVSVLEALDAAGNDVTGTPDTTRTNGYTNAMVWAMARRAPAADIVTVMHGDYGYGDARPWQRRIDHRLPSRGTAAHEMAHVLGGLGEEYGDRMGWDDFPDRNKTFPTNADGTSSGTYFRQTWGTFPIAFRLRSSVANGAGRCSFRISPIPPETTTPGGTLVDTNGDGAADALQWDAVDFGWQYPYREPWMDPRTSYTAARNGEYYEIRMRIDGMSSYNVAMFNGESGSSPMQLIAVLEWDPAWPISSPNLAGTPGAKWSDLAGDDPFVAGAIVNWYEFGGGGAWARIYRPVFESCLMNVARADDQVFCAVCLRALDAAMGSSIWRDDGGVR